MASIVAGIGLFPLTYYVRSNARGSDTLAVNELLLHFLLDTSKHTISGVAHIIGCDSHSTLDSSSFIYGDWCVNTEQAMSPILVVADGVFPYAVFVDNAPAERENLKLTLSLSDNWQTGFANVAYFDAGRWLEMNSAQVTLSSCCDVEQLIALSHCHQPYKVSGH